MPCSHCDPERKNLGDYNIEKCVLSCMMQAPDSQIDVARSMLSVTDFDHQHTGLLFDLILKRHDKGELVDVVSLTSHVFDKGMDSVLTPLFLSETLTASPDPMKTEFYAKTVLEFSKRRQMCRIALEVASAALSGVGEDWRAGCIAALSKADLVIMGRDGHDVVPIKSVASQYVDMWQENFVESTDKPVPTGIRELDKLLDGGIRREYVLISGRQGHGKSLLAMQIAGNLANSGRRGLVVGYDMSALQVVMRDIARESGVPLRKVMGREASNNSGDFQAITRTLGRIMEHDVHYTTSPYITFEAAAAHARALHRQKPLDWMVVDYLQRVPLNREANRREVEALLELGDKVDKLQKELGITMICPVQQNDDSKIRDARGLLDAPQVYLRIDMDEQENQDGEMEAGDNGFIAVIKNRFGATNRRCPVFRNGNLQKFEDREYTPKSKQKPTWGRK